MVCFDFCRRPSPPNVSYWTLSHSPLTLTDSHGLILTSSCEALALLGNFRPFVARDSTFTSRPFGHPTLGSYIRASSSQEIRAFMVCLLRLHAHCGCYRETAFVNAAQSGPPGPFRHLQEKYGGPETNRGEAWKVELKVSEDEVLAALGRHFLLVGFRG